MNLVGANATGLQLATTNFVEGSATGTQVALFANRVVGDVRGMQIGVGGNGAANASGLQLGLYNWIGSKFDGFQIGLIGVVAGSAEGAQFNGVASWNGKCRGLQIGLLFTRTGSGRCLQLGLLNFNPDGVLPVLPFFNVSRRF